MSTTLLLPNPPDLQTLLRPWDELAKINDSTKAGVTTLKSPWLKLALFFVLKTKYCCSRYKRNKLHKRCICTLCSFSCSNTAIHCTIYYVVHLLCIHQQLFFGFGMTNFWGFDTCCISATINETWRQLHAPLHTRSKKSFLDKVKYIST